MAGLVAQIKWFAISEIGESRMKEVLNELKRKLDQKNMTAPTARDRAWHAWLERSHKRVEEDLKRATMAYLRGASKRYEERLREYVTSKSYQEKGILDLGGLLAVAAEQKIMVSTIGQKFYKWFALTGSEELDRVYRAANVTKPLDLVFGRRDLAVQLFSVAANEMSLTTAKSVQSIVQNGLIQGLSISEISKSMTSSLAFSRSRATMIARTEATQAVNRSTAEAYSIAAADGINIRKQWLSARDERVRETHAELDGVIVGVDEPFEMEGATASSPASFGVPSLDINCRCTLIPVIDNVDDLPSWEPEN